MKISIFGAGYVGLVTGTCLAELGNDVIIVDIDKDRVRNLKKGISPIYEPGLSEMIVKNLSEDRILFTDDSKKAIQESDIIFIAVGTPPKDDGSTDLSHVLSVAKSIGENINDYKIVINKSTVPVGTADKVKKEIKNNITGIFKFDIVSNPEFLKEGTAIQDFMIPDRIIVGVESDKAKEKMEELYSSIARTHMPLIFTDIKSAELTKYAANAMLACRISFMNQLAPLCEKVGADIKEIAKGIGLDDRIGPRFLQAGAGYGGSCFPKDVQSLAAVLRENDIDSELIDAIETINKKRKESIILKIKQLLGNNLKDKKISLWGISFKPKTDDIREAPSLTLISQLINEKAKITVFDPEAMENSRRIFPEIKYSENMYDCLNDSDCIVLLTEWDEFRNPDWEKIKKLMKEPNLIDCRNIYNPKKRRKAGFNYLGIGRK